MSLARSKLPVEWLRAEADDLQIARMETTERASFHPMAMLGLLLSAFVLLQCCLPLRTAVKIGADEGFELAKATLCLKGYHLYTEIWNDQPPLDTFLITQILRLSPSVFGPRLMTIAFALVLLASVFLIVLRVHGLQVAALTTRSEEHTSELQSHHDLVCRLL